MIDGTVITVLVSHAIKQTKAWGPTLVQPGEDGPCDLFKMLWEELGVQDCVLANVEIAIPARSKKTPRSARPFPGPIISESIP